ncbi:MAG TPA: Hsp20/alpha crystallin family protein [Candidatus Acidoferrum sp.]|nr:Hsp20/alpha crystallin family protein [Candidatus Acidoferrum sp.]
MNETSHGPQDRLLTQLAAIPACQAHVDGADWFPPVDIVEDAEEYLFRIDLPDVRPDDLQVAVEEDQLVICGERANPWQSERKLLRVERPHGYFVRRFALPDDANPREINTLFAESVLEIRLRKAGSGMHVPAPTNAPPRLKLRANS